MILVHLMVSAKKNKNKNKISNKKIQKSKLELKKNPK